MGFFTVHLYIVMASNHMNPDDFAAVSLNSAKAALDRGDIVLPITFKEAEEIASMIVQYGSPELAPLAKTLAVILVAKGEDASSSLIQSLQSPGLSLPSDSLGARFIDVMEGITTTDEYHACSTQPNPTCPEHAWGEIKRIPTDES